MENLMAAAVAGAAGQRAREFVDWIDPRPVAEQISRAAHLIPDVAAIAAQYIRIGAFASNFWQERGINVGEVRPINPAFYDYWYDRDPVDPTRRVCDTHHWPVWIPEGLSLATVERAGLRFDPNRTVALRQHRNTPARGGYYAVMRKEVLGSSLRKDEKIQQLTGAGYPGLAQAAAVAAVIFAINQHDGSRWLGDSTGAENSLTYTLCVERVEDDRVDPLVVGCHAPSGVSVTCVYLTANLGVAAVREF